MEEDEKELLGEQILKECQHNEEGEIEDEIYIFEGMLKIKNEESERFFSIDSNGGFEELVLRREAKNKR